MPSRCESKQNSICEPALTARAPALTGSSKKSSFIEAKITGVQNLLIAGACLGFFCLSLPLAARASTPAAPGESILICDNSAYDGATLPPPSSSTKKKNQVAVSTDDGPDDPASKKRHKKQNDSDTASSDSMSGGDTAGGATLPLPKKANRPDGSSGRGNTLANEREGKPGSDRKPGHDRDHDQMFGKGPLDLTALSLTDEQKQKIAQMHADNGTKMRDLMRKRRELSMQMKDTMFDADINEAQIRAKRDEVRQVQEKLEDLRLNDFLAIRSLLTPEQRLKLKDVKIANNHPREGDSPSGPGAKREGSDLKDSKDSKDSKDPKDSKKLADSPAK